MSLFDYFDNEKPNNYETNHFHIYVNGEVKIPVTGMDDKTYAVFVHEYIHYVQHLTTMFGVKLCETYNKIFYLFRDYLVNHSEIRLPISLSASDPCIKSLLEQISNVKGDSGCNKLTNIDDIEIDDREIEKAKKERKAVTIGAYDFTEGRAMPDAFDFGYTCVIEGMAHLVQSLINPNTNHASVPYLAVQEICKKRFPQISNDPRMMIAICICALMFDNPGCGFFEVIEFAKRYYYTDGEDLFIGFMTKCSFTYKEHQMPVYMVLASALNDYKISLRNIVGNPLVYYNKVIDNCIKKASSCKNGLLDYLYNCDITDKSSFKSFMDFYGIPFIESSNLNYLPEVNPGIKNRDISAILAMEIMVKRFVNSGPNHSTKCIWFDKCSKNQYTDPNQCKITKECTYDQWNKTVECLFIVGLRYFRVDKSKIVGERDRGRNNSNLSI